jgi:hypothetical protein
MSDVNLVEVFVDPSGPEIIEVMSPGPPGVQGPAGSDATATTDASLLVSGTLDDARLSSNVALENVANVFTAKQSFSGTTHSGLCLHSLTTSEYNALTATNGDLFRDSTTDRIDARLSRGTVELIDSAGGQTINGALTVSGLLDLRKGSTTNILQFATNTFLRTDTSQLSIFNTGINRSNISLWRSDNFVIGSSTLIAACSNLDSTGGSVDTSLSRASAGVWQMGTTAANASGSLNLNNLSATGTITASQTTGNPTLNIANPGNSSPDACARIGTASAGLWVAGANYGVRATAGNAATVPFTARGFASQTANLQEWQNSAGAVLASVSSAGNLTASGTLRVGGGTVVQTILSATATLNFPSISSNDTHTLTITVTGAVAGDSVFLGVPATLEAGLIFCASVTAADTVTVQMHNSSGGSVDPASGTFRATVIRF